MMHRLCRAFSALVASGALLFAAASPAHAAARMTIATGVDPGFAIFYVAKLGGFFERNGLDVDLRTGPSGGAMVPLLISDDSNASMAGAFAGVNNHLRDPDIVAVAQTARYDRWYGIVARNDVKSLADLKSEEIGVTLGNASESYFYDALSHAGLKPADFKSSIVNIEAPEMIAAIERGDVQAFSAWEPWLSRATTSLPDTHVLVDNIGTVQDVGFIYMNRKWIAANPDTARRFMLTMKQTNDYMHSHPEETSRMVGKMLNLPRPLMDSMMPKITFTLTLGQDAYTVSQRLVDSLVRNGKIKTGHFDFSSWFDTDLLRDVDRSAVTLPGSMH